MRGFAFLCVSVAALGHVSVGNGWSGPMAVARADNSFPTSGVVCPGTAPLAFLPAAEHGRNRSKEQPGTWEGVGRIVAVGDVHGDYDQLVAVLKTAGLIDDPLNWLGGKAHLVQ